MKNEFVTYTIALRIKELGFDEKCFAFFQKENLEDTPCGVYDEYEYSGTGFSTCRNSEIPEHYTAAPTPTQVFRWFREKYKIFAEILTDCTTYPKFCYTHTRFFGNPKDLSSEEWGWENNIGKYSLLYQTYEEAELVCIEKILEIIGQ